MKQAIIIPTWIKDRAFLDDLLKTLIGYTKYPIIIHTNTPEMNEFEMGAIRLGKELEIDEFFVLPHSTIIKNAELFDIAFEKYKGATAYLGSNFMSYTGKYRLEILKKLELPEVRKKLDACIQEFNWNPKYLALEPNKVELCPDFWKQPERFEFKHGRKNLITENEYLKKFKGCWTSSMMYD
jgi:hypothetical protein